MKQIILIALLVSSTLFSIGQVSINQDGSEADPSSMLDVKSTDKGLLVPRMTSLQRDGILSPAAGLLVFDTDTGTFWYFHMPTQSWIEINDDTPDHRLSDADADTWIDTELRTDNDSIIFYTSGMERMTISHHGYINMNAQVSAVGFSGDGSGLINVPGDDLGDHTATQNIETDGYWLTNDGDDQGVSIDTAGNVGIGTDTPVSPLSLFNAYGDKISIWGQTKGGNRLGFGNQIRLFQMYTDRSEADIAFGYGRSESFTENMRIEGTGNVGIGTSSPGALLDVAGSIWQSGIGNSISIGIDAGPATPSNITHNVFVGFEAGKETTTGASNCGIGNRALSNNITGEYNTAIGSNSLYQNEGGDYNTACGRRTLYLNTEGYKNTATGGMALYFNETGFRNTADGYKALYNNTTGSGNTASGNGALLSNTTGFSNVAYGNSALYSNTELSNLVAVGDSALYNNGTGASGMFEGKNNTALGSKAMFSNTTGSSNTAVGYNSLYSNISGYDNTAIGRYALEDNTTGSRNTATGNLALINNTTGFRNSAYGFCALRNSDTAQDNVAIGAYSLYDNNFGDFNTSIGVFSSYNNSSGVHNTASGYSALLSNTTGNRNTASGSNALYDNETGNNNTACGVYALDDNIATHGNTALGYSTGSYSNSAGEYCTFVGYNADITSGTGYTNSMALGNGARINDDNQVHIGNSSIDEIGGYENWSNISDSRYKVNVKENVHGLDFILKLRPVTYQLDISKLAADLNEDAEHEADACISQARDAKSQIIHTGLIAQEVEAIAKAVGYDFSGVDIPEKENEHYGIRYAEFVMPLIKGMQEQQAIIEQQQLSIELLRKEIEYLKIKLK